MSLSSAKTPVALPRALCQTSSRIEARQLVPLYFTERDIPWLRVLLDEHERFVGKKRSALRERLREPLPVSAPKAKLRVAIHVLDKLSHDRCSACVPPQHARWRVFRAAVESRASRQRVLEEVAVSLSVTPAQLESALFADLQSERCLADLPGGISPATLARHANQAIVCSLLRRADQVRVRAWGNTRALVRHARLLGLICVVRTSPEATDCTLLEFSGPLALFHRTELYGRALASLIPRLAWCHRFELQANCALGRGTQLAMLSINSNDPIATGRELRRYDSKVESAFVTDFMRAAPDWDVVREPCPLEAEGTLLFPDFELVHRLDPRRRWLLEIVGFWTREYLEDKLRRLRAIHREQMILCIDQHRCCGDSQLPTNASVVRYKSRIDPRAVLAIVDPPEGNSTHLPGTRIPGVR